MNPSNLGVSHLVVMLGIPGAGKSYFAEHFASTFQAPLISFEQIYNQLDGIEIDQKAKNLVVNRFIKNTLKEISKTKRTIIFDSMLYSRASCDDVIKASRSLGYKPLFILVQIDKETAKKRLHQTNKDRRMPIINDMQFDKITKQYNPIENTRKDVVVISGKHTYASQLKIVLKYLSSPQ